MERLPAMSPSSTARMAGLFYLLTIVTRMNAESVVRHRTVVSTDAVATAGNILANERLFLLGFVAGICALASYIVLTAFGVNTRKWFERASDAERRLTCPPLIERSA